MDTVSINGSDQIRDAKDASQCRSEGRLEVGLKLTINIFHCVVNRLTAMIMRVKICTLKEHSQGPIKGATTTMHIAAINQYVKYFVIASFCVSVYFCCLVTLTEILFSEPSYNLYYTNQYACVFGPSQSFKFVALLGSPSMLFLFLYGVAYNLIALCSPFPTRAEGHLRLIVLLLVEIKKLSDIEKYRTKLRKLETSSSPPIEDAGSELAAKFPELMSDLPEGIPVEFAALDEACMEVSKQLRLGWEDKSNPPNVVEP